MKITKQRLKEIIKEELSSVLEVRDIEYNQRKALDILADLATSNVSVSHLPAYHHADETTKALVSTALKDFEGEGPGTDIIKAKQKILSGYSLDPLDQHKTLSDIDSMEAQEIRKVLPWYWRYAPASIVFSDEEISDEEML